MGVISVGPTCILYISNELHVTLTLKSKPFPTGGPRQQNLTTSHVNHYHVGQQAPVGPQVSP